MTMRPRLQKNAYENGTTLKEAAMGLGLLTAEEFDEKVRPEKHDWSPRFKSMKGTRLGLAGWRGYPSLRFFVREGNRVKKPRGFVFDFDWFPFCAGAI